MLIPSSIRISSFGIVKPIVVLYATYFTFFLSVFIRSNETAIVEYISTLISILLILLVFIHNGRPLAMKKWKYHLMIFIILFSAALLVKSQSHYTILLYFKIVAFILFFSVYKIPRQYFINFINRTYLLYLSLSTLVWLRVVPNIFYQQLDNPDYYVNFNGISFNILSGIEGSPAAIDTYSAVVLLINIFMNQSRRKSVYIFASIIGMLASFRMTPFVALFGVFIFYPFYKRSKYIATAILMGISIFFIGLLIALYVDPSVRIFDADISLRLLAYGATHARSMIWVQQLEIMVNNYTFLDYIFGRFSAAEFSVPTYQLEGAETGGESLNPHNNYLLLLFRSPFLLVLFAVIFLVAQYKSYSKYSFPVILLIFLAALTNSSLIGLGNPTYILLLIYVLLEKPNNIVANNTVQPKLPNG